MEYSNQNPSCKRILEMPGNIWDLQNYSWTNLFQSYFTKGSSIGSYNGSMYLYHSRLSFIFYVQEYAISQFMHLLRMHFLAPRSLWLSLLSEIGCALCLNSPCIIKYHFAWCWLDDITAHTVTKCHRLFQIVFPGGENSKTFSRLQHKVEWFINLRSNCVVF